MHLNRRQALVDGGGGVAFGFEYGAVSLEGGAGEGRSSLLRPLGEEVIESLGVHGAGRRARDVVKDQALDCLEGAPERDKERGPSDRIHDHC
jgi:hypothetical protein